MNPLLLPLFPSFFLQSRYPFFAPSMSFSWDSRIFQSFFTVLVYPSPRFSEVSFPPPWSRSSYYLPLGPRVGVFSIDFWPWITIEPPVCRSRPFCPSFPPYPLPDKLSDLLSCVSPPLCRIYPLWSPCNPAYELVSGTRAKRKFNLGRYSRIWSEHTPRLRSSPARFTSAPSAQTDFTFFLELWGTLYNFVPLSCLFPPLLALGLFPSFFLHSRFPVTMSFDNVCSIFSLIN